MSLWGLLDFFTGWMPFLLPNQRRKSTERSACTLEINLFACNCTGRKPLKHVLRPEDSNELDYAVCRVKSIEWDPLSTDYLLVSTAHSNIMLVDSNTASVLTYFELPSAAAEVHTLAWIPSAPGMFCSGGESPLSLNVCLCLFLF